MQSRGVSHGRCKQAQVATKAPLSHSAANETVSCRRLQARRASTSRGAMWNDHAYKATARVAAA